MSALVKVAGLETEFIALTLTIVCSEPLPATKMPNA